MIVFKQVVLFFFRFKILTGMLESIRGLCDLRRKDYKVIYKLWRWRIVKQNELDGDVEFTTIIGLIGKLANYWKSDIIWFWKSKGVCRAYRNPISKFDVGQMSSENKRKTCEA